MKNSKQELIEHLRIKILNRLLKESTESDMEDLDGRPLINPTTSTTSTIKVAPDSKTTSTTSTTPTTSTTSTTPTTSTTSTTPTPSIRSTFTTKATNAAAITIGAFGAGVKSGLNSGFDNLAGLLTLPAPKDRMYMEKNTNTDLGLAFDLGPDGELLANPEGMEAVRKRHQIGFSYPTYFPPELYKYDITNAKIAKAGQSIGSRKIGAPGGRS